MHVCLYIGDPIQTGNLKKMYYASLHHLRENLERYDYQCTLRLSAIYRKTIVAAIIESSMIC